MKTRDGKKVILYCERCPKVKPFDEWVLPNEQAKKEIQSQRQNGCIKFLKSTCDSCIKK